MSKAQWSNARKESRQRFKEAIHYAHRAMADTKVRVHYEKIAKKADRQAFRVAVSDFLRGKNLLEKK